MDNENMKRWRDQEFAKTEHNADPQCDYPKDCARVTVELIDEVLALRAQVTEARRVNEVQIESLRLANDALVRQREEARQVARTFIVHANSSCDECAAAADIVDAWPLPGVAL